MTYDQSKLIKSKILELCDKIAEIAIDLIDIIAPPDFILGSTLGHSDGQLYKNIISPIEKSPDTYQKASFVNLIHQMRSS